MTTARDSKGKFTPTHDKSYTREYNIWGNMIYRCTNPNSHLYINYGGRGIKVCKSWLSFENFITDMGQRPSEKHSLDRIDVNKEYSKNNCRWASPKEQARNRRNNIRYCVDGENLTAAEISEKYDISLYAIQKRIYRGQSIDYIIEALI